MNPGFNRIVIALVAFGLMGFAIGPTGAEAKSLKLGVISDNLELNNRDLAPGTSLHRLSLADFTADRLARIDGLILGAPQVAAIEADAEKSALLRNFILDGHPVFLAGTTRSPTDAIGIPSLGSDMAFIDGKAIPGDLALTGLFVNDDGSYDAITYSFNSVDDLRKKAAGKASTIISNHENRGLGGAKRGLTTMQTGGSGAYWTLRATASYCAERAPQGELCYTAFFHRLDLDLSSTYDWWNIVLQNSPTPGAVAYGSTWRTSRTWSTSDADYYRAYNKLVDYGPGNAYNLDYVSYNIGTLNGVDGALETVRMGVQYDLDRINAVQASWKDTNDFYIRHELDYGTMHTGVSYSSKGGYTIRVCEACSLKLPYGNKAEFLDYATNQVSTIYINSWREIYP